MSALSLPMRLSRCSQIAAKARIANEAAGITGLLCSMACGFAAD